VISSKAVSALDAAPRRPFLRQEALASGIPPSRLDELLRVGLLNQPFREVLVRADLDDTLEVRAAAVRLVLPTDAALCRTAAAWLYGIDARPPGDHLIPPPLECCVPVPKHPVHRPGLRCYVTDLEPGDMVEVAGLPCTTPNRTAIDLARWSMPGMGLAILDVMARRQLIVPDDLLVQVERWRGDRFVAQARRLITLCDARSESYGESWLRLRFHDAGFPKPDLQISLTDDTGREIRRLDLGYRKRRHAWEYDGEQYHLGLELEAADRRRREEIEHRWGWIVTGVGKNLVLGPSMALEYAVGEVIDLEPRLRRRQW